MSATRKWKWHVGLSAAVQCSSDGERERREREEGDGALLMRGRLKKMFISYTDQRGYGLWFILEKS